MFLISLLSVDIGYFVMCLWIIRLGSFGGQRIYISHQI